MYFLFLLLIFIFLLIGVYYFYFIKGILKCCIKNDKLRFVISIIFSIILCLLWPLGMTFKSILTPFMIYFTIFILIFNLVFVLLKKYKNISVSNYVYLIAVVLSLSICIYGSYNINNQVETKYDIKSEKHLSEDLKILFLSDCHYGNILEKKNLDKMMEDIYKINDISLVLLGGDITDEATTNDEVRYIYEKFGKIKSKYGIYFVYGNHDGGAYGNSYFDILTSALSENNINVLDDEYFKINDNIALIGRKDFYYGRRNLDDIVKEDLSDIYTILVDHQPRDYSPASKLKVDLILSAHTHAGQIFPGELLINTFKTSDNAYGYKNIDGLNAIVSSGVSGWGIPVRTEKHSEYVIVNVKN